MTTRRFQSAADLLKNIKRATEEDLLRRKRIVVFTIAQRIRNHLAELTPVDTGYLRMTLWAGDALPSFAPRDANVDYRQNWTAGASEAEKAIWAWSQVGGLLRIGYTAEYAPYVEDYHHMVKDTVTAVPGIIADVLNEARGK